MNATTLQRLPEFWRAALLQLLLVLGTVLVAHGSTAMAMLTIWSRSETFAHAFLVPPIVLWLIWRRRSLLATLRPRPCPWVLLPMACVAFVWLLGELAATNSVTQLAMTALLVLAVPAVLGLQVAHALMFPLGFLFFAVPIGEFLLPQLMNWTADFTALALRSSGIPVYHEGMRLVIPSGTWSVIEACSGVRYLIASVMVGTLFAYLNYQSIWRRWVFVGIAVAVPIVANWIRAYLIVLIGHLSDNKIAAGVDHVIYGWLFFGIVIGLMFMIGGWWSEPDEAGRAKSAAGSSKMRVRPGRISWVTSIAVLMLVVGPQLVLRSLLHAPPAGTIELADLDVPTGGWQRSDRAVSDWRPAFQNASPELNAVYREKGQEVGVYIGYYRQQNYERKLVSSTNELARSNDPEWIRTGPSGSYVLEIGGVPLTFRGASLHRPPGPYTSEQRLGVWQIYWVGDKLTASDYWAKIYSVSDRLLGHGDDAAVIVIYAEEEGPGGARATVESFARANLGLIVDQLRRCRDRTRASIAVNQPASEFTDR